MVRGLYAAAAGMMTIQEQTATTSNNLANADTTGFKADLLLFTSAPGINTWRVDDPTTLDDAGRKRPEYIGLTNAGVMDTTIWHDFSQGQLVHTGQPLDVAIVGPGFLRVRDASGEYYSRDGELKRGGDGFLTDNQGRRVQGQGGDINVGTAASVEINRSGEVYADGVLIDRLAIASFADPQADLTKVGTSLWRAAAAPTATGAVSVQSGFIERSNVDAVSSIVELIAQLRHYEAAQRVVQTEDSMLGIAASQIGKLT